MASEHNHEVRRLIAETAALRKRAKVAIQNGIRVSRDARKIRQESKQLLQKRCELAREFIHLAKNVRWGLALHYGQPHDVNGAWCWTIARHGIAPLTVKLKMHDQLPATLWVFDPHRTGDDGIQSVILKNKDDAEASFRLVQHHLAVA